MENRNSVDQRCQAVAAFFDAHRKLLACQGSLAATWRRRADARTGPYYLLVVRDAAGRRRSIYLGVAGPLVDEVRAKLASIQAPKRERRVFDRVQQQLRAALRSARQELDLHLAPTGLWRKGSEIRGWRRSAARKRIAQILQNHARIHRPPAPHDSRASQQPIHRWRADLGQNRPADLSFAAARHGFRWASVPIRAASAAQRKSSKTNRRHLAESSFLAPAPLRPRGHPEKPQTRSKSVRRTVDDTFVSRRVRFGAAQVSNPRSGSLCLTASGRLDAIRERAVSGKGCLTCVKEARLFRLFAGVLD